MDAKQLRDLIADTLDEMDNSAGHDEDVFYSPAAVELLMLTAAVESNLGHFIKQVKGPAQGVFQMEPATEKDIWENYLEYRGWSDVADNMLGVSGELVWNLKYAIMMARFHYYRVPEPLPAADDVLGLAAYWKTYYNTEAGKGTVERAIYKYETYCMD